MQISKFKLVKQKLSSIEFVVGEKNKKFCQIEPLHEIGFELMRWQPYKKTFCTVIITIIDYDGVPLFCFIGQHHEAFVVPKNLTGDVKIIIDRTSDYNIIAISDGKKAVILRDYKEFLTLNMKTGCFKIQQE